MAKGPERVDEMKNVLRKWQSIERKTIDHTSETCEQTENPLIRMVMEIIQHDSMMHHRVQQFIIDTMEKGSPAVSREDVGEIWARIEEHDQMERKTIQMAEQMLDQAWSPIHKQMLEYLLADEKKHDVLLCTLNELKGGMTKMSGA